MKDVRSQLAEELREALKQGVVSFSYEKTDGTWREAKGTRSPTDIEEVGGVLPKGTGTEKPGTIAYWDVDSEGWRSCKEDKIIAINKVVSAKEYINSKLS